MDATTIKQDFPILNQQINDEPLTYLDSAATSQMPTPVLEAINHYYQTMHANVHRSTHTLGNRATDAFEEVRQKVAQFIQAPSAQNIVFTKSTTDGLNILAQGLADLINPGDEIVVSIMEHHSNLVPWQQLAKKRGATLKLIGITSDGYLDLNDAAQKITAKTKIVALAHVSNVLGVINPIQKVAQLAHQVNACMIVDGAQAAPHLPVDVVELDADFYAFSGHKMLAPTGIGVLYGKTAWLKKLKPVQFGGEMIDQVRAQSATFNEIPWCFEAGTPNISGVIGLGAAIDYLQNIGMARIFNHEQQLIQLAIQKLSTIDGLTIYGPTKNRTGVIAFNVEQHPHDYSLALDMQGVEVRAGFHCAQPLTETLKVSSTLRASFYLYNDEADVERLVKAVIAAKEFFNHGTR